MYQLTNKDRVKERLSLTSNGHDVVIERIISAVTRMIEGMTNRVFVSADYAEKCHIYKFGQEAISLKNYPVTKLTKIEYRVGTPNLDTWATLTPQVYELLNDGINGLIRLYSQFLPQTNALKVTYTAGYLIDWAHTDDATKHTLPEDLTDLAERLTIRVYKKREAEGRSMERNSDTSSVTWDKELDPLDKETISNYKLMSV